MQGSENVRFSHLFADTVLTHGAEWARKHYLSKGMSEWEFNFWQANMYGQSAYAL